jgi:ParB-like chromosome segregation protein Spo0J
MVDVELITKQATEVQIKLLKLEMSPRIGGQDLDHVQALAFRFDDCPPILVERSTSTVLDGVHRVLAARMLGRETVAAHYFEGTHEEAFVEAIRANVTHGKPLTLTEREAAARKLLAMHSDWSNRLVADVCALSDKTVARLRKTTAEVPQLSARLGRDGRRRPINPRQVRDQIADRLKASPDADPELLAQSLSTSASTVRDVRRQLRRGQSPNGSGQGIRGATPGGTPSHQARENRRAISAAVEWREDRAILALPSGNELAEWLDQTSIRATHWAALIDEIPLGRIPELIQEAESRSVEWTRFAAALEDRFRELNRRHASSSSP